MDDPKLKVLDNGAAQLTLNWTSRRPYDREETVKMQSYEVEAGITQIFIFQGLYRRHTQRRLSNMR